jgi:hypothetical protein
MKNTLGEQKTIGKNKVHRVCGGSFTPKVFFFRKHGVFFVSQYKAYE